MYGWPWQLAFPQGVGMSGNFSPVIFPNTFLFLPVVIEVSLIYFPIGYEIQGDVIWVEAVDALLR